MRKLYYVPLTVQANAVARSQTGVDLSRRNKKLTVLINIVSAPNSFKIMISIFGSGFPAAFHIMLR
jgi:hypothetical protein